MEKAMGFSGFGKKSVKKPGGKSAGISMNSSFANAMVAAMGGTKNVRETTMRKYTHPEAHRESEVAAKIEAPEEVHEINSGKIALPITHKALLKSHEKTVSAIAVDRTGTRLVTGGLDYNVKLWHFSGMDSNFRPFKTHTPFDGYPLNDLCFSSSGETYVASLSHRRPMIFSRDGAELKEFATGDVYIMQQQMTRGHTDRTTSASYLSDDDNTIITSSHDGTARLWNPETADTRQIKVWLHGRPRNGCMFAGLNGSKKAFITTGDDGAIRIWGRSTELKRASMEIQQGSKTEMITHAVTSSDGRYVVGRGDGTVALWDTRNIKKPVVIRDDLPLYYENSNIAYGPSEKLLAVGTAANPVTGDVGQLVILDSLTLENIAAAPVGVGSVSKVVWSTSLNQILVGSQDGNCHVFYNPIVSLKGVLLGLQKSGKIDGDQIVKPVGRIICPTNDSDSQAWGDRENKTRRTSTKQNPTPEPVADSDYRTKGSAAGPSKQTAYAFFIMITSQ